MTYFTDKQSDTQPQLMHNISILLCMFHRKVGRWRVIYNQNDHQEAGRLFLKWWRQGTAAEHKQGNQKSMKSQVISDLLIKLTLKSF